MLKAITLLFSLTLPLAFMGLSAVPYSYGYSEEEENRYVKFVVTSNVQPEVVKDDVILRLEPVWPVDNPDEITSDFGYRFLSSCEACSTNHQGVDFPLSDRNNKVYASMDGVITRLEHKGEYGLHIYIEHKIHDELVYSTIYAHLRQSNVTKSLSVGDKVSKGQHIAYIGNTGLSTGPHLHFEVHKGDQVLDPEIFIAANQRFPQNLKK